MSKSPEWKERREKYISERRRNAKARLEQAGFTVTEEDKYTLTFLYHCNTIRFFPYTGGVCGKGIKPTRGIDALIQQLT
jgi:hypothetical protein